MTSIHIYPHDSIPSEEWIMCSSSEAQERRSCNELSSFEYSSNTEEKQKPDPYRCVKKYRRSAAGGGISRDEIRLRSLEELDITVRYLLGGVFVRQRPPHRKKPSCHDSVQDKKQSLCSTVNFIDDRIRAVQVDLKMVMGRSIHMSIADISKIRRFEAMIVRYHLLSQYLLFANMKGTHSKSFVYEWRFALSALRTSLASYLDTWRYHQSAHEKLEHEEKDEIMSYVALLHISAVVRCNNNATELIPQSSDRPCGLLIDDGDGLQALLSFFKKYHRVRSGDKLSECCPKFWFVLQLAIAINEGNYIKALRMLTNDHSDDKQPPLSSVYHIGIEQVIHSEMKLPLGKFKRWKILVRCCIAQLIPFLYVSSLRYYNKTFMKEENVSVDHLGQLLGISRVSVVIELCRFLGLPITTVDEKCSVCMKKVAISFQSSEAAAIVKNPCRTDTLDPFVFGEWAQLWLPDQYVSNSVTDIIGKLSQVSMSDLNWRDWGDLAMTVDEHGIRLPPSPVMWECIKN